MISTLYRKLSDEAGLTLSEMLVVLAITGIILGSLSLVLTTTITQGSQIQEQSISQTEVRGVVDEMAKEIRQAYSGDSNAPILTASASNFEFLSPDKQTPFHNRKIAYRIAGGKIDRALTTSTDTDGAPWTGFGWSTFAGVPAASWATRVSSVSTPTAFRYFNASGTELTGTITPSAVKRVDIEVTVASKAQPNRKYSYSTSATLRWQPE